MPWCRGISSVRPWASTASQAPPRPVSCIRCGARGRLDLTAPPQRTPFVGREVERAVLQERAAQVRQGLGQVVLLRGEAGIGKSRLVQVVTTTLVADDFTCIECRCSPY